MGDALVTSQRLADGAAIIDVRGELDVTTVSAFRTLLVDTITRQQPARVVVDMFRVTFMDSTGIGALVVGYNAAHEIGAEFVVQNPSSFVLRQLHITGLTDVFGLPSSGRPASEKTTQRPDTQGPSTQGPSTQGPATEEQAPEEHTSERRATRRRSV